jgi:hypothetical protein
VLKPFLAGLLDSPYAQEALSGDLERIASIALPHLSGNGQKRLRAQIGTLSEGMRGSGITMRPWSRDDYMRMIVESTASSLEHLTWPYEHDGVRLRKSFARAFFDAEDGVWRRQLRYDYEPGYSLPGGKLPRELHMSEKSQRLTRLIYATSKTIAAVERSPHAREFADPLSLLRRDVEEFVGRYLSLTDGGRSPPPERFAERSLVAPEYGLPDSQTAAYFALGLHTLRDHPLNLGRYGVTHHDLEMRAQDVLFGGAFRQHTVTDRLPLLRTALGRPRIGLLWGQTGEETAYRGGNSDGDIALVQLVTAMGERK